METKMKSRREFLTEAGAAAAIATTAAIGLSTNATAEEKKWKLLPTNKSLIPPLADHWRKLDLAKLLSYPTAFVSISQCNSLYSTEGAQGNEMHGKRGSLEATVKVAKAARTAGYRFHWIGYDIFRDSYPKTEMDDAQYSSWTAPYKDWSKDKIKWDGELPNELKALVQPDDAQYFEIAHQSSFVFTPLHMDLSKRGIKTIIFTGIHLDWCIEGNSRQARDLGFMPIVVGDATACQKQEDEPAAFNRINNFFAPIITSDYCVELIERAMKIRKA
ncbi:MAG: cysteine hydrolase [Candidatus Obscuribacterales bacterium]|nr:cysteine hydrolase [Candidatus Obscuribacterales bacterium]